MITEILRPNENVISKAVEILNNGGVVAIPTETVYGLAGDARNARAINKIFKVKGRPQDNPLIAHISDLEMLKKVTNNICADVLKLAKAFWPGPLTIILPKSDYICKETCAGLNSVGVRMPQNETTREIINRCGYPLAAPSANLSGKPSPTNANDVKEDLNGKIPLIIDDGECAAGVESTVLSMLDEKPIVLRPGIITANDIEKVLGKKVAIAKYITEDIKAGEKVLSPGMKYKHYSPKADITIVKGNLQDVANFVNKHLEKNTFVLCFDGEERYFKTKCVGYGAKGNAIEQAHNIFSALRTLDKLGAVKVFARCPEDNGVALAVYNRLIRSAGFKIVELGKTQAD